MDANVLQDQGFEPTGRNDQAGHGAGQMAVVRRAIGMQLRHISFGRRRFAEKSGPALEWRRLDGRTKERTERTGSLCSTHDPAAVSHRNSMY
jgi:hypothetical protein